MRTSKSKDIALKEEIEFCAEIKWETPDALLLTDGVDEWWVPKSQILNQDFISEGNYEFTIPEWLAIDKGIV